jgi:lipopolysaccharide biosynthesis glycosyltransferase
MTQHAYATLVMGDPKYIAGAITLLTSLKISGTKYDIICLITPDIFTYVELLREYFTSVFVVDYIKISTKPFKSYKRNNMYNWINKSYTKYAIMDLIHYEKVCFIDADSIVSNNIDHLFKLQTPVGVFSNHWFDTIQPNERINLKTCNYYIDVKPLGQIKPKLIHQSLTKNGFVASGNLLILSPNRFEFKEMIENAKSLEPFGFNCSSGGDEQLICYYQSIIKKRDWVCLKQPYNVVPWKLNETLLTGQKPYIIHFNMTPKPWNTERLKWIDNEIWWEYANNVSKIDSVLKILEIEYKNVKLTYCPFCHIIDKNKQKNNNVNKQIRHNLLHCKNLIC